MLVQEFIVDTKLNLDSNSNKKPLGSVQEENSQETDKKHSVDHSSDGCPVEEPQPPPVKLKKMLKKKKSSNSADEQWEDSDHPESVNR